MITAALPILGDDVLRLEPFCDDSDENYLIDLIERNDYTKISRDDARRVLCTHETYCWVGYDKCACVKVGVVYLTRIGDYWTLDAYRDEPVVKRLGNSYSYSYNAGRFVMDYYFENIGKVLYTAHYKSNRAATIMCKKLGFTVEREIDTILGRFVILKKEW